MESAPPRPGLPPGQPVRTRYESIEARVEISPVALELPLAHDAEPASLSARSPGIGDQAIAEKLDRIERLDHLDRGVLDVVKARSKAGGAILLGVATPSANFSIEIHFARAVPVEQQGRVIVCCSVVACGNSVRHGR